MTDAQLLPVIWILASMVLAVLVTLFITSAQLTQLAFTLPGRVLIQFARLVYYLGIPYTALLMRAIAPVDMGLTGVSGSVLGWTGAEWLSSVRWGLAAGALALIPIGIAARQLVHAGYPLGVEARSTGAMIVDGLYTEIHWAFYRTAPLILVDSIYVAALLSLGLIGLELLVSLLRNGLGQQPEERQSWLGTALLLTLSTTLFVLTRNLWLMIVTHITVEILLKVWTLHLTRGLNTIQPQPQARSAEPVYDPDVRPLNKQPEV